MSTERSSTAAAPAVSENYSPTKSSQKTSSPRKYGPGTKAVSNGSLHADTAAGDKREGESVHPSSAQLKRKFEMQDAQQIKAPGRLARKRIRDAKHKARSELVSNDLFNAERYFCEMDMEIYKTNFTNSVESLPKEITPEMMSVRPFTVDRIDGSSLTEKEFIEQFERPKIPAIFTHLVDHWPAMKNNSKWSSLAWLDRKFRNQKFKCGEDDSGCSVKIKMKYYLQYMMSTTDDSPLYIFDSNYGEHPKRKKLLDDYEVPHLFKEDLFQHAGENKRPPYRWFVMGPPRSGTGIHIDPLGTSAWNSLIRGAKRWCLLPNEVPKHLIKPLPSDNCSKQKDEAITWFRYVHPRVTSDAWPAKWRPIEFVQWPGETVFVPGGWWHVVLNLDISIAMTQNYCNSGNFKHVFIKTAKGRPRFCHKWYRTLKKIGRDDLIEVANQLSKNNPEYIPNLERDLSSSDSSSDTSSASSDDSSVGAAPEVEDSEKLKTVSSHHEVAVGANESLVLSDSANTSTTISNSSSSQNSCSGQETVSYDQNGANSPETSSDDDSGVEEQDKKRRKMNFTDTH